MNCEVCAGKFTRLKDLVQHGTSEKHSYTHFFCVPCAMSLYDVTDVIKHVASKEHSITVLATGIYFDIGDHRSDIFAASFPSHNCCFLCGYRDCTADNAHVKSDIHKYTTWLLRAIIKSKKIYCSDRQPTPNTQALISKFINIKRDTFIGGRKTSKRVCGSLPFVCDLCNLHFNKLEYHEQHLEDSSHKRMEQFLISQSHIAKEIDIIDAGFHTDVSKTFCNSIRPLFYCEECSMWIDTIFNYVQHRKSNKHKRVKSLWNRCIKREIDAVSSGVTQYFPKPESVKYKHRLESEVVIKSEQFYPKHMNVSGKASKKFKTSSGKHQKHCHITSEMVSLKEKNPCCRASETISKNPDFEVCQIDDEAKISPRHGFEASQTTKSSPRHEAGLTTRSSPRLGFENWEGDVNSDQEHYCELCEFLCYSSKHYGKHLMGDQHKRMRRLINKRRKEVSLEAQECQASSSAHSLQYNCELCDVFNHNSDKYEHHLNTAMHKKNQWLLYVLKQRPL